MICVHQGLLRMLQLFNNKPGSSSDLTTSWYHLSATSNPNGNKVLLANGLKICFIKGKPVSKNGPNMVYTFEFLILFY